jgi:tetratricopeptide (TPR) repeat protein
MARRAFVPPPSLATDTSRRPYGSTATCPPSRPDSMGLRPSAPAPRSSAASASASSVHPDSRRPIQGPSRAEGVPIVACAQLLDRLAAADEAPFLASWIESTLAGRGRTEPTLAVRLLRAYRETGRIDRARDLAASLPSAPSSWQPLDAARVAIERCILATLDGRGDHAEAELRLASHALAAAPKGTGLREQLDFHLAQAQLELKLDRNASAVQALRLAEHVSERIENGAWRASVAMTLGHLSMRLADPRTAARHYTEALLKAPARGAVAMSAHGNAAIALGSIGRFDEGRHHASQAVAISGEVASGWRHADAYDVSAIVEIAADRPVAALTAIDEGLAVLGDIDQRLLRLQLTEHRTWALAMLGRAESARNWLAKAETLRADFGSIEAIDDLDLAVTRARTLEAAGELRGALHHALEHVGPPSDAFVSGSLNLIVGRCALALGDEPVARAAVERAALSGDRHGWVFPDRRASLALWRLALTCGDSRVVRYAECTIALAQTDSTVDAPAPAPRRSSSAPIVAAPSSDALDGLTSANEGEPLIYVTTPQGVARIPMPDLARATAGATLVVDTLTHALRVNDREVSLERRRALEPLVVQLLRRAREGLSADEILRAAGGPGPESADAEHRVRVLISRVRDLLGDPAAIERVRDAGEHGRTRYRLAATLRFALVEPLFSSAAPH